MGGNDTFALQLARPLKHRLTAIGLSLLMAMNIAPEYGFGLAAYAAEAADYGVSLKQLQSIVYQRSGGGVVDGLPGAEETSPDEAYDAFKGLLQSGETPDRNSVSLDDHRTIFVTAGQDGDHLYGSVFLYNSGDGDESFSVEVENGLTIYGEAMVHSVAIETPEDQQPEEETPSEEDSAESSSSEESSSEEASAEGSSSEEAGSGGESSDVTSSDETSSVESSEESSVESSEESSVESSEESSEESSVESSEESTENEEPKEEAPEEPEESEDQEEAEAQDADGTDEPEVKVEGAYVRVLSATTDENAPEDAAVSSETAPDEDVSGEDVPGETESVQPEAPKAEIHYSGGELVSIDTDGNTAHVTVGPRSLLQLRVLQAAEMETMTPEEKMVQTEKDSPPYLKITPAMSTYPSGDTIIYTVKYYAPPAAPYAYGPDDSASVFQTYKDVKISIPIPEGLTFGISTGQSLTPTGDGRVLEADIGEVPYLELQGRSFTFTLKMARDASIKAGTVYAISGATFSYSYDIRQKEGGTTPVSRSWEAAADATKVTVTASEPWEIRQSVLKNIDTSGNDVVVKYRIEVGRNGVGDSGQYDTFGRLKLENFLVSETFSAHRGTTPLPDLKPLSSKITLNTNAAVSGGDSPVSGGEGQETLEISKHAVGPDKPQNISEPMHYSSIYDVEVHYPKGPFIVPYGSTSEGITLKANAVLKYQPLGEGEASPNSEAQTEAILIKGDVATLALEKYIREGDDSNYIDFEYNAKTAETYKGPVEFTLTPTEGSDKTATTITLPTTDGGHAAQVQLRPGKYTIAESSAPQDTDVTKAVMSLDGRKTLIPLGEITLEANKTTTVAVVNKATANGGIVFQKYGTDASGTKKPLAGATFKLVDKDGKTIQENVQSDKAGQVRFSGVKPGAYNIVETAAPKGYIVSATGLTDIEVKAGEITNAGEFPVNVSSNGKLEITKKIRIPGGGEGTYPGTSFKFNIYRNGVTDTVAASGSTNASGKLTVELPVYDVNADGTQGAAIEYVLKEELPADSPYYMVDKDGTEIDQIEFTMTPKAELTVYNTYTGKLSLKKQVVSYDKPNASEAFTFQLYKKTADGPFEAVKDSGGKDITLTLKAGESNIVSGLNSDPKITYYWYETPNDKYVLKTDGLTMENAPDGKVMINAGNAGLNMKTLTVTNVAKAAELTIKKTDENGKALSSAEFDVYPVTDGKRGDKINAESLVTGTDGIVKVILQPGTYQVEETKAPENYALYADKDGNPYQTVTIVADGTEAARKQTVTFTDKLLPELKITKTVGASQMKWYLLNKANNGNQLVVFKLYPTESGGTPVQLNGQDAQIELDMVKDTVTGSIRLPAGTYFLEEQPFMVDGFLGLIGDDGMPLPPTRQKIEVTNEGANVTIENLTNFIDVEVSKIDELTGQPIEGAEIEITSDWDGSPSSQLKFHGKQATDANGKAGFILPIFTPDGNRILYTIKETKAAAGYEGGELPAPITTYLKALKSTAKITVKIDADGTETSEKLEFTNTPYVTVTAKKVWTDWTDDVNHSNLTKRPMAGATLGIYKQNGASYDYVESAETDAFGIAQFGAGDAKLLPGIYVVAEIKPAEGFTLPADKNAGPETGSITDLGEYIATKPFTISADAKLENHAFYAGELVNTAGWAQFKVTKVKKGSEAPYQGEDLLNYGIFDLYRQEAPAEGTAAYSEETRGEAVGHYVSGFSVGKDQVNEQGVFHTGILEPGYIYWLVETAAPDGYKVPEGNKGVIAFAPQDSLVDANTVDQVIPYTAGKVTNAVIPNEPDTGSGGGEGHGRSYVAVMFDKVLREAGKTGVPLGGAKFSLYIQTPGGLVLLDDSLVTGKDSSSSQNIGRALSNPINLADLLAKHPDWQSDNDTKGIAVRDKDEGDKQYSKNPAYSATLVLRETWAPAGVIWEQKDYTLHVDTQNVTDAEAATLQHVTINQDYTADGEKGPIVNTPSDKNMVVLKKYGYVQTAELAGKTDDELAAAGVTGTPLAGVMFDVYRRQDDKKNFVRYKEAGAAKDYTLTTGTDGTTQGALPDGVYRLVERLPKNLQDKYTNTHSKVDQGAYEFTVQGGQKNITLYNPEIPLLRIEKMNDKAPANLKIQLTGPNYNKTFSAWTGSAIEVRLPAGIYTLKETDKSKTTTGRYFAPISVTVPEHPSTNTTKVQITNPTLGAITIKKFGSVNGVKDETLKLEGAKFDLRYQPFKVTVGTDGKTDSVGTAPTSGYQSRGIYTTGNDGTVTISGLEPGWYKIFEKTAPAGYVMATDPQYAVLYGGMVETPDVNTVEFLNEKHGGLTVTKTFDKGTFDTATIPGSVTFNVYKDAEGKQPANPSTIKVTIVDGSGTSAPITLPAGTYYLQEVVVDGWYRAEAKVGETVVTENLIPVTIASGGSAEVSVTNKPLMASVTLKKVDSQDQSKALEGAVFELRAGGTVLATLETRKDGTAAATFALPKGTTAEGVACQLVEVTPPETYQANETPIDLTIKPGDVLTPDTAGLTVLNQAGVAIKLTKYVTGSETTMSGVEFTLYRQIGSGWEQVEAKKTGPDGTILFDHLAEGIYAVAENEQALTGSYEGYALERISGGGAEAIDPIDGMPAYRLGTLTPGVNEIKAENRAPQTLTIYKRALGEQDNSGTHSAQYEVYGPFGEDVEALPEGATPKLTSSGHKVTVQLQPGKYFVREIKSDLPIDPDNPLTKTVQTVTVADGQTPDDLIFYNAPNDSALQLDLTKTASPEALDRSLLEGESEQTVTFTLKDFNPTPGAVRLKSLTLTDQGLTAFSQENGGSLVTGVKYTVTNVGIGSASYKTYSAENTDGTQKAAAVMLSIGDETFTETLDGAKSFSPNAEFTAGEAGVFTLTYTGQGDEPMSDFAADAVTITVILTQEGGETVVPARRVVNTAFSSAITAGGQTVNSDKRTAEVRIPEGSALPTMAIDKIEQNFSGGTANVGSTLRYQITLSNTSETAIRNPVIVDTVPASLLVKTDYTSGKRLYTIEGGTLEAEPYMSDGYWVFKFKGELKQGAPITITYDAAIQPSAMETHSITAIAYGTSLATIPPRDGNTLGMSFRADNSSSSGGSLTTEGVEQVNSAIATGIPYGYVTKGVTRNIGEGTGIKITKEISTGDGFIGEGTNAQTAVGGTIIYQLTIWNDSTNAITDVRLLDVLPHIGDVGLTGTRSSQWPVSYVDGSGEADSGDARVALTDADTEQSIKDQLASRKTAGGTNAIFVDFGERTIDSGKKLTFTYKTTAPNTDDPKINDYFYQLAVNNFSAMYNNVIGGEKKPADNPITSNLVTVGLTPSLVAVGGTVWIDEDMDGILDENERSNADLADALKSMTVTLTPHYKQGDAGQPVTGTISQEGKFLFDGLAAAAQDGNKNLYDKDYNLIPASLRGKAATYYTLQVTVPDGFALTTPYGGAGKNKRSLAANDKNIAQNVSHVTEGGTSEAFFLWPGEKGTDTFKNVGLVRTRGFTVNKVDAADNTVKLPDAEFQIHGPFGSGETVTAEMVTAQNLLDTKATDSSGSLIFGGLSAYQQYVLVETKAPLNYTFENAAADVGKALLVDGQPAWVIPAGKAAGGSVTVKNESAKASLTIQKVVEGGTIPEDVFDIVLTYDGKPYTGAYQVGEQTLTAEGGVIRLRADETAAISGLTVGKPYQVAEPSVPAGYAVKSVVSGDGAENWVISSEGNAVTVTNSNIMNGKVTLNAAKTLLSSDGSIRPLLPDQFTFQVTGGNLTAPLTAKNDANGTVTFPEISFTGSDIGKSYTYTISEVLPAQNPSQGITYDTSAYTATVTVTGSENGALLTQLAYSTGDKLPAFTNTYKATGELTLGAFKRVEGGATLRDGQFTFLLKEERAEYSQEATNKADGTVTFAPISYEEPGEHDYTITEKSGFEYGYDYSTASYKVHVTVTDNGDGTLAAKAAMDGKDFDPKDAEFVNRFAALSLDLYKHRYGNVSRAINGAEFTLYRYDESAASNRGVVVGSGVTSGGGRLRFENLEEGRYVLLETYVPYRYSALKSQYEFSISNDGSNNTTITLDSGEQYASVRDHTLYVPNRYHSGDGGGDDSYRDDGSTDGGGGGGGGGNSGTPYAPNPLTQIPDAAVPLAPGPAPLTTIPDEDVPLGGLPNTGGFPVGAFAVIGGLLALLGIKLKRKHREDE